MTVWVFLDITQIYPTFKYAHPGFIGILLTPILVAVFSYMTSPKY